MSQFDTRGGNQVANGRQQFIDGNGRPLVGGRVYHYLPNTLVAAPTFQDPELTQQNTHPIILDAAGMATIHTDENQLRQILRDRFGNTIWDKPTGIGVDLSGVAVNLPHIAALRANVNAYPMVYVKGYRAAGDGGEGVFYLNPADTTTADDGGTVIVDADGRRYCRNVEKDVSQVSAKWWGAVGDSLSDDTQALQRCFDYAADNARVAFVPSGTFYCTAGLVLGGGAVGIVMDGQILSQGGAWAALTLGDGGVARNWNKRYGPVRVARRATSAWDDEADVGVRVYNCDACTVNVQQAEGFTIGVQTVGDARGFEDTSVTLGRIVDNRYGLDVRCETAEGWNNSVRYFGGHFACSSSGGAGLARYGVRFSAAEDAYGRHNAHAFYGPAFELQRGGTPGTVEAIPFLFTAGDERGVHGDRIRMEACSPYVARADVNVNDCSFNVIYTGTYAFAGDKVLYGADVSRSGISVFATHQAQAAQATPRLFADASNLRARVHRDTSVTESGIGATGAIGFEQMGVLSGAPNTAITGLDDGIFAGLTFVSGSGATLLQADAVGLTTSRAVVFVVDTARCKEIFVAAEGEHLRLVVQQYDANEAILGEEYPIRVSNMNVLPNFTAAGATPPYPPMWWEGNVDLDHPLEIVVDGSVMQSVPDVNRLQRVQVNDATRYAAIGVRGGQAGAVLRSLRLYCDALQSPPLIYGGGRAWGQHERGLAIPNVDLPYIAPGGRHIMTVAFPNLRHGDEVTAAFARDGGASGMTGYLRITASANTADTAIVTIENVHGDLAIDMTVGTLYVQARKARI